ncbi:MAG: nicotinate-nucleotide--dimethylbenzimidazole phosphoribosyltransferase [Bryobacteraceae bacterium]|nr:nicotinate-nucleotide--dimethylbenzimidazole phosphoribosyltransferase [Bryobacteraceae bacterium]
MSLSEAILARLNSLTKPPGSLGEMERLAHRYCLLTGQLTPPLPRKGMYLFCADHGVVAEGVSAYPAAVTAAMVENFHRGGAAINVLCRHFQIEPVVIDCGVGQPTANFAVAPAMSITKAEELARRGRMLAYGARERFDLVGLGEMGIGNTTAAAALLSAFTGLDPSETAGAGTGLDAAGVVHKAAVIRRALALHPSRVPREILANLGGSEIATMTGFILAAAEFGLPIVVDGFISSAAALVAQRLNPDALKTAFFSHRSAEPGHAAMLAALGAAPALDLGMRLGEGSGAALMINLIETSLRVYLEMATFTEAGVPEG